MADLTYTPLDDLTVLDARGPDVVKFLQGQVSHDVTLLASRGSLLASLNNPQGRVIAVLRLLYVAEDHVLIVLPAELAETALQLLTRFVLRAKVKIVESGTTWQVYGVTGPDAEAAASTRICMPMDAAGWRQMIVAPRGEPLPDADPATRNSWRLQDIEAGLAQVLAATSEIFVAQMLNLDRVDAISWSKGCYTGQEVVARAHYRGQVKRRMQRFLTESMDDLEPGKRIHLRDGRNAQIVMAAPAEVAGQQFLAVTQITTPEHADPDQNRDSDPEKPATLECVVLPLPYSLPL